MVDPKFGIKRSCPACEVSFYDLNKTPATCPKCGHAFDPSALHAPPEIPETRAESPPPADEDADDEATPPIDNDTAEATADDDEETVDLDTIVAEENLSNEDDDDFAEGDET